MVSELQERIIISCIVVLAFVWGYKGEAILERFETGPKTENVEPAEEPAAPEPAAPEPAAAATNSALPKLNAPLPAAPAAPPPSQPYANPYQRLMEQAPPVPTPGSLGTTLDSIRRDPADASKLPQRNAYFEKLSEQLRQLRGEQPPPTPDPAVEPVEPQAAQDPNQPGAVLDELPGEELPPEEFDDPGLIEGDLPPPGGLFDDEAEEELLVDEYGRVIDVPQ